MGGQRKRWEDRERDGRTEKETGGQRKRREDNITEWTGKILSDNLRRAEDGEKWIELVQVVIIPMCLAGKGFPLLYLSMKQMFYLMIRKSRIECH